MKFSSANGDLLMFQQMHTGLSKLFYQIVLRKHFRTEVLSFAHENPLSGHLGVTKTYYEPLNHFFCPCMKKDVSKFCRSCHICKIVGKPNQKIPRAPLQPIPAFEELFSSVIFYCVEPFPKSKSGNEYTFVLYYVYLYKIFRSYTFEKH